MRFFLRCNAIVRDQHERAIFGFNVEAIRSTSRWKQQIKRKNSTSLTLLRITTRTGCFEREIARSNVETSSIERIEIPVLARFAR